MIKVELAKVVDANRTTTAFISHQRLARILKDNGELLKGEEVVQFEYDETGLKVIVERKG